MNSIKIFRRLAALLCVFMLIAGQTAFSSGGGAQNNVTYVYFDARALSGKIGAEELSQETRDALYELIYNAAKAKQTDSIDISSLGIKYKYASDAEQIVLSVIYEHPELYYLETRYGFGIITDSSGVPKPGDTLASIKIFTLDITEEENLAFLSKADYIIASVISEGMSDEDKALALHDYIVDNTSYYDIQEGTEIPREVYTSYSVFMNNVGVCQGYSLAYNLLLSRVGIESKYVSSRAMNHGWSMLKLGDSWYHADLTWDDPTNIVMVSHDNFLLSDEGIANTGHYGWSSALPQCSDKKFENKNYCFNMVNKLMKYKDGKFLYCDYKQVELSQIAGGQPYYTINGKYYITEYVKTKFDGSGREAISEAEYNAADSESAKIYAPIKNTDGLISISALSSLAGSSIYVKTNSYNPLAERICVAYYNSDKSLAGIYVPDMTIRRGYIESTVGAVPSGAVSAKIIYWNSSANPLAEYVNVK